MRSLTSYLSNGKYSANCLRPKAEERARRPRRDWHEACRSVVAWLQPTRAICRETNLVSYLSCRKSINSLLLSVNLNNIHNANECKIKLFRSYRFQVKNKKEENMYNNYVARIMNCHIRKDLRQNTDIAFSWQLDSLLFDKVWW